MKKIFNLIMMAVFMATASTAIAQEGPTIQFNEQGHDFGVIAEGPAYQHTFKFKNTGKEPLVITNVNTPCGCTTPSFTKEPVMPGKTGEINVSYNSQGRIGVFNKTLSVQTNMGAGKDIALNIKGEVKTAAEIPAKVEEKTVVVPKPVPAKAATKKKTSATSPK